MARNKAFIDTNVLVYQFDSTDEVKRTKARSLVTVLLAENLGVISSQVVQEFMNVALKKFRSPMTLNEVGEILDGLLKPLCEHFPTMEFYEKALKLHASASLSLYDALIIQAAQDLGCTVLYSEDLQDGQTFGSLKVVNPFK
jgi:predicted nucleic acid-binding protein